MTAIEAFRIVAAEFADVKDAEVNAWIELTAPLVSKRKFGKLYAQALALLVAHRMKMSGNYEMAGEDSEGGALNGTIGGTLRLASLSEGSRSVSFYNGGSLLDSDAELGLTAYGVQFLSLRRRCIIPIICSGMVET